VYVFIFCGFAGFLTFADLLLVIKEGTSSMLFLRMALMVDPPLISASAYPISGEKI
jgi:hypothetical protein